MSKKIAGDNKKRAINIDSALKGKFTAQQMRDVIHAIANLPDIQDKRKYHYLFLVDRSEVKTAYEKAKQRGMTLGALAEKKLKEALDI